MARRRSSISWRRSRRAERARLALALAILLVSACKRDDAGSALAPEIERHLDHCASTLERLPQSEPSERAAALARGCPYACQGLDAYGHQARDDDTGTRGIGPLAEGCGFFCSERAREAFERAALRGELAAVVGACGPDYYGLREGSEPHFSDTFFVLHRVGEWLHAARAGLPEDSELRDRLDAATASVHLPLPLPARLEGVYELPRANVARAVDAAFYVVVTDDEVRGAAVRIARLRGGRGIELRPVPGGAFPGDPLPETGGPLEEAYLDLGSAMRALHRDPEVAAAPPLLLASGELSAERLLAVAVSLGQPKFRLGVAGRTARAHPVVLERIPQFGSAAPTVELAAGRARVPGTEGPVPLGDTDEEALEEALRHLVALRAPLDRVEVEAGEATTVAHLVRLADAAHHARIRTFTFAAPDGADGE